MADTSKSNQEVVTEKELEPVLKNTSFDSVTFLRLYNEWKATKDTHLFASLRKMHEDAGYNNKNIVFGAEQEMHEIAAIIQKYQESKDKIVKDTTNARSTVQSTRVPDGDSLNSKESMEYPDKQKAFAESLKKATSFPFAVKYSENNKSYELIVSTSNNMIKIGDREYIFQVDGATIRSFRIEGDNVIARGSDGIFSRDIPMTKDDFIKQALSNMLNMQDGTNTMSFGGGTKNIRVEVVGAYNPKSIDTPIETNDTSFINAIKKIKIELDKRIKEGLDPIELMEGFRYISDNVKDEGVRQIAINTLMGILSRDYAVQIKKDGSIDVIAKDEKNKQTAATFQQSIQNSISANNISLTNIRESMLMMTGKSWSDYSRVLVNPSQASAQGYAKHLADMYDIDLSKNNTASTIKNNTKMPLEEKTWLLSYLDGQMDSVNMPKVTENYLELVKGHTQLLDSNFYAIVSQVTGAQKLNPAQAQAAAEAAARGSSEGEGEGKGATWALGILGAIVGLGFKKGEGWSLWTALKRIFMGGLAIGGVMLGCAAGREWKKELGMDVCEEAKKALKDGIKDLKNEVTSGGTDTTPTPAPAPAPQQAIAAVVSTSPRTPSQEKGYQAMKGSESQINASIEGAKKKNPKLIGTIDQYEEFIRSSDFQSQKLSSLIFTGDPKDSIFTPTDAIMDLKVAVPPHLHNGTLKLVLRAYLGIGLDASGTPHSPDWGRAEKDAFIAKARIDDTWKDKTFSELTKQVYA